MTAAPAPPAPPPEPGQLVRLRNRLFLVDDVVAGDGEDARRACTRIDLECLDDDRLGESLSVLWEREIAPQVIGASAFPVPAGRWDSPAVYGSFLRAIRWSATSLLRTSSLLSPFRGAIELEPYQLEPAARAVLSPRVNLLIADDVGLGKTIEAGLVLQELLARGRARNCLVVCPASLQRQWVEEMLEKFNLEFRIVDRDAIRELRREYGTHVNPWRSYPRLVTSMDFLKRESALSQFRATLSGDGREAAGNWDLLILDEAHNCAPSGRRAYIRDSDRTRMLRQVAPHFQHRLFLTATPHNGYTESFTALLEELDPLRFHRGPEVDSAQVEVVMVRRLKEELAADSDRPLPFPKRTVRALRVPADPAEQRVADLLERYVTSRARRAREESDQLPVWFALGILRKRFLSSPRAFRASLEHHIETVTRRSAASAAGDLALTQALIAEAREDLDDDRRKDAVEKEAIRESSRLFSELTPEEEVWLTDLSKAATASADDEDRKFLVLADWIAGHLGDGKEDQGERLLLFTEYADTLEYLEERLVARLGRDRVLTLLGGSLASEREAIKKAFQAPPAEHPVRVLIATDAAAEGLNLQKHCRYLVHYEIPWNPNRLEQRNGRIDRHGQPAPEVFVHHFLHENRSDSAFLETVIEKVGQMRRDLGSVAAVIEEGVERFMLGESSVPIDVVSPRRSLETDVRQALADRRRLGLLHERIEQSRRELDIAPERLREMLDAALRVEGHAGLEPAPGDLAHHGALLRTPPPAWGPLASQSVKDAKGRLLTLVFDPELARGRRDVTLVHLNHPLLVRALATFRRNMFAQGVEAGEQLARVSYEVFPDRVLPSLHLVATARLVAVGTLGQKLHEELHHRLFRVSGDELVPTAPELLDVIGEGSFPPIPSPLSRRLERIAATGRGLLGTALSEIAEEERRRVERDLDLHARDEETRLRELIDARRKEIRERIALYRKKHKSLDPTQMLLDLGSDWTLENAEQLSQDIRFLERRLERLDADRENEPKRAREKYRLRDLVVFPLGLRFLVPGSMVGSGK